MEYHPFIEYFPNIGRKETRKLVLKKALKTDPSLPAGEYVFVESYCTALDDCRRVFLNVKYQGDFTSLNGKMLAVIGFGWEDLEYYRKDWATLIEDGLVTAKEMKGPNLERGQPQSRYAKVLRTIIEKYVVSDQEYVDRLARHSSMMNEKLKQQIKS